MTTIKRHHSGMQGIRIRVYGNVMRLTWYSDDIFVTKLKCMHVVLSPFFTKLSPCYHWMCEIPSTGENTQHAPRNATVCGTPGRSNQNKLHITPWLSIHNISNYHLGWGLLGQFTSFVSFPFLFQNCGHPFSITFIFDKCRLSLVEVASVICKRDLRAWI